MGALGSASQEMAKEEEILHQEDGQGDEHEEESGVGRVYHSSFSSRRMAPQAGAHTLIGAGSLREAS